MVLCCLRNSFPSAKPFADGHLSTVLHANSFEFFLEVIFLAESASKDSDGKIQVWFEFFNPRTGRVVP